MCGLVAWAIMPSTGTWYSSSHWNYSLLPTSGLCLPEAIQAHLSLCEQENSVGMMPLRRQNQNSHHNQRLCRGSRMHSVLFLFHVSLLSCSGMPVRPSLAPPCSPA